MFKNTVLNTIGSVIYFFLQWSTTVLAVRLGSFEIAGNYSLAISFTNLFYYLALFGIRNYQISDVEKRFSNGQYFAARLITAFAAICCFGIVMSISNLSEYTCICYVVYMTFKLGETFTEGYFSVLQVYENYLRLAFSYTVKGVVSTIAFSVSLAATQDLMAAIIGMTVGYWACICILDIPHLQKMNLGNPKFYGCAKILTKCLPLMLVSLSTPVMNYVTRNAIDIELNSYLLGQYSSLSSVVMVMGTFAAVVFLVFIPKFSELKMNGQWKTLLCLCFYSLIGILFLGMAAMIVSMILGKWVCKLIFGEAILENFDLLIPLILTATVLMCKTFFASVLVPLEQRWPLLFGEFTGVVLCAILTRPMTRFWGMQGTNLSYMAGVGLQFLVLCFFTIKTILKNKEIIKNSEK